MDKQAVRRKILRGSLAAPVVLTVSSASAAATTSFVRCLKNNTDPDGPDRFFTHDHDNWYRQQVPVSMLWAHGQEQGYYFLDQVRNVYVSVSPPNRELSFGSLMPPGWKVTQQSSRWALVWFDKSTSTQYSKITMQRPQGASATTMSCYGSFKKA